VGGIVLKKMRVTLSESKAFITSADGDTEKMPFFGDPGPML
jgi:hypothetical protein